MKLDDILNGGEYAAALKDSRDGKKVSVFDARFFEKTFFAAALEGRKLYVCGDTVSARTAYEQLKCLNENTVLLPAGTDSLVYKKMASAASEPERLNALHEIACGRAEIVVAPVFALMQKYPDPKNFSRFAFSLSVGEEYDLNELKKSLVNMGYKAVSLTEGAGQFSSRGDILDIWATGRDYAVRAEFFGDELESLRKVDGETYLSSGEEKSLEVIPATDVFYTKREAEIASEELTRLAKSERTLSVASDIKVKLAVGSSDLSLSYVRPLFSCVSLSEYMRPDTVVYDDAKTIYDTLQALYKEFDERFDSLLKAGETMEFTKESVLKKEDVFCFESANAIAFHRLVNNNRIFEPNAVHTFKGMDIPDYSRDFYTLASDLKNWSESGYVVHIACGNEQAVKNMGEFLTDNGIGFSDGDGVINLYAKKIDRGGIFHDGKRVVIGTYNIGSKRSRTLPRRRKRDVFTVPEVGDYVVHETHGIGMCIGVEKMNMTGSFRDYLIIEYSGSDRLYVPVENMDSLSKFVASGEKPKLSKLGGEQFERVKSKVRASVKKLAFDLVALYAERSVSKGCKYDEDDCLLEEFESDFPFTETEDQLAAVAEGLKDLKSGKVMDRLLCGDVGYGKTEVALRLAFKVISCGKQAAFISPTTILACQHYETAVKRMKNHGVRVERLTRFDSPAKIKETLKRLEKGETDFVVGTHRVLGKDVKFKDLGLLILDEEQRFGVADKEKLKLLKPSVNVLSLSATPIPRTLYMTMVNIRDVSVLDTPPADRIPVQTFVTEYSDALAADAIMREVGRGGQAFIVYNRVAGIDSFAAKLRNILPDVKFAVAHGQMPENLLEKTVADFVEGRFDVLVASTIIENGIDMPRANTLIVADADRLGLAQLYQLRGRVGRSNRLAYAYFTYDSEKVLTEAAYKRLEAITKYTEFGSGFKIAMADLEIRGAGNILGKEQHGHLEKVGYDLYCKLLEDAVAEAEGREVKARREVRLTIDYPAYLPDTYVEDSEKRMGMYSRIALISSAEDRVALSNELTDVYGKPPTEAENLLEAALLKNLAADINAVALIVRGEDCRLLFEKALDIPEEAIETARADSDTLVRLGGDRPCIRTVGKKRLLNFLLKCRQKRGLNV